MLIINYLYLSSCKDEIENFLEEDLHEFKLEWTGYYNVSKDRIFSGSFNSVQYLFDEKIDNSNFAMVIKNSTVGQLSLEMISLRLGSK